jgi:hypothetical protein
MENIKQKVICYSNIIHLHVELKWNKEMKMEGSKCCSQMGWLMQKPICKISSRIIKPLKAFLKEVPMDKKGCIVVMRHMLCEKIHIPKIIYFDLSVVHNYNIMPLILYQTLG